MKTCSGIIILLLLNIALSTFAKDPKSFVNNKSLCFIENRGQITDQSGNPRNDIQFKISAAKDLSIFIGKGQLHYQWADISKLKTRGPKDGFLNHGLAANDSGLTIEMYRMDVILLNSNPNAEIITEEKLDYTENYFMSAIGGKGTKALSYKKITYKNIYPNIDWVLYISSPSERLGEINYDFIVHPGGNVKDIKLQYNGATSLSINKERSLCAKTPFGNIIEQSPYTYERESNKKITSSFVLKDNILSFNTDNYNNKNILVIDPALAWATYFGGSGYDWAEGLATDQSANVYIAGYTTSTSNIATAGSYLSSYSVNNYGFLAKFDNLGNIQWATYYYGNNASSYWGSHRLTCDPSGNVYITGDVSGTPSGMATAGAYQTSNAGGYDAYLAKFDPSGSLLWATFFGGTGTEYGTGVSCDPSGNVYMTGWTSSSSGIATSSAYQTSMIGSWNQYLAKFSSTGSIQWSTYFGGSCSSSGYYGNDVACDGAGNVYICGTTCATSNIATSSAFQTSLGGGYDGYLAKFTSGGSIVWATYYGGSSTEWTDGITCDDSANVFMTGYTYSTNNIASSGAYQTSLGGAYDAFLVKFDSSGNRQWGTYYGGSGDEWGGGVACNSSGQAFISGYTTSTSNIATSSAYQTSLAGSEDAFLAQFSGNGNLLWATYFGGSNPDGGSGVVCDIYDNVFTCGWTYSTSGIATTGAYQTSFGGGTYDGFLAKWGTNTIFNIGPVNSTYCTGDTFHVSFFTNDTFQAGNIFKAQLSDSSGSFTNGTIIGSYTGTNSGSIFSTIPATTIAGIHYHIRILSTNPADTTLADSMAIHIKAKPVFTVSSNSLVCEGKTLAFTTSSSFIGLTFHWSGPNTFSSSSSNPVINPVSLSDSGYYYVSDTLSGCFTTDTIHVPVLPGVASPVASANVPCIGDTLKLNANTTTTGVSYSWTGPNTFSATVQNPFIANATSADAGIYHAIFTLANGCADTLNVPATVSPITGPPIININVSPSDTICAGTNITLTASVGNASSPAYQWRRNGIDIVGATSAGLTTGFVNNGDIITCKVTSTAPCQLVDSAISNAITMHVLLIPPPNLTLIIYAIGDTMTFSGHITNGNTGLTYQWTRNGVNIPGAVQSSYTTWTLNPGDIICLIVHSSVPCTVPDSLIACTTITTGINGLQTLNSIKIYPNPITNELIIEGAEPGTLIKILNVTGQEVYTGTVNAPTALWNPAVAFINTSTFANGTYILELIDTSGHREIRKIVK